MRSSCSLRTELASVRELDDQLNLSARRRSQAEDSSKEKAWWGRPMQEGPRGLFIDLAGRDLCGHTQDRSGLVFRVLEVEIVAKKDDLRLCPRFVVVSDGGIKAWNDGFRLRFLAPMGMERKEFKKHVKNCLEKWLLANIQFQKVPQLINGNNMSALLESDGDESSSDDSSCYSFGTSADEVSEADHDTEEDEDDLEAQEEEEEKKECDDEVKTPKEIPFASFSFLGKDLKTVDVKPHSVFLFEQDEDDDLESVVEEDRISIHGGKTVHIQEVKNSRFAPFREVHMIYPFRARVYGLNLLKVKRIESSISDILETPTLYPSLSNQSIWEGTDKKIKLCWDWVPANYQSKVQPEQPPQKLSTVTPVLHQDEMLFTFECFFEKYVGKNVETCSFEVIQKLLLYKCRFTRPFVENVLSKFEEMDEVPLKELSQVMDKSMIHGVDLSQEDIMVVKYLFPNSCNVQVRKLVGGFSGSLVLQTISYGSDGHAEDSCVVKLDSRESILEEERRHRLMINHLGDHAPLVLGKHFSSSSGRAGIKISLAGDQSIFRGTNSQNQANHLITLKDLYLFEQSHQIDFRPNPELKRICLDKLQRQQDAVEFLQARNEKGTNDEPKANNNLIGAIHSVHNVLLEVFGDVFERCTVQSSMMTQGDVRTSLYDIKGVLERNCLRKSNELISEYLSGDEPFWHEKGLLSMLDGNPKKLFDFLLRLSQWLHEDLGDETIIDFFQGMCHGDLNGANIVVDNRGMPWVIDFMHSGVQHALRDLLKLTSCVLLEYTDVRSDVELRCAIRLIDELACFRSSLAGALPPDVPKDVVRPLVQDESLDLATKKEKFGKFQLAWQTCRMLRGYCSKYTREAVNINQYHAAMLFYSISALSFQDTNPFQKRLALASILIHSRELMGLERPKILPRAPSSVGSGFGELVDPDFLESATNTKKLQDEVHMKSYLNRIAIACGHQMDPVSRELFQITDTVDLAVHAPSSSKRKDLLDPANSAIVVPSPTLKRKKKPPPLKLGSTLRNFSLNERSSRFFEYVRSILQVDMTIHSRIAICGPSACGKTIILKKLVTNALTEQEFFIPVYIELQDVCKFLRRRLDTMAMGGGSESAYFTSRLSSPSQRNNSNSNSSSGSGLSTRANKMTYLEFMENSVGGESRKRPMATLACATKFFADSPTERGRSTSKRSSRFLMQRDVLRLHQLEILSSPKSPDIKPLPSFNSLATPTSSRKRFLRNQKIRQLSTMPNPSMGMDLLELYWSFRFGERSPMFQMLTTAAENKQILLFFDGLDDMRPETQEDFLTWLDTRPDVTVIMTSRREKDLRGQLHKFSFVHVKPLNDTHIKQMIKSHVMRRAMDSMNDGMSKQQQNSFHARKEKMERFLQEELKKPMFREIISGSPLLVNLLIYALTNHWNSTSTNEGDHVATEFTTMTRRNSVPESENMEDVEWGLPQILRFAVLQLIQADRNSMVNRSLVQSAKLCMTDDGINFFQCMAFSLHLKRASSLSLGHWLPDALQLYIEHHRDETTGLRLSNSVNTLMKAGALGLIVSDSKDQQWIDRRSRFSIHVLQEYLVAGYIAKELQRIRLFKTSNNKKEMLQKFFLLLNVTSKDPNRNEDDGPEFEEDEGFTEEELTDDEEEKDDGPNYLSDDSSSSGGSTLEDSTASSSMESSTLCFGLGSVRTIKLLSDPWWQSVFYLTLKIIMPGDIGYDVSLDILRSLYELTGTARFCNQVSKFVRFLIKTGDDKFMHHFLTILQKQAGDDNKNMLAIFSEAHGSTQATPLMHACRRGNTNMVKILVDFLTKTSICGTELLNKLSQNGESALMIAAEHGHLEIVKVLINNGADMNLKIPDGPNSLYLSAYDGHSDTVEYLLQQGADPNSSFEGTTCLFNAAFDGNIRIVQLLLEHGANPHIQTSEGFSALQVAKQQNHQEIVQLLLEHKPK